MILPILQIIITMLIAATFIGLSILSGYFLIQIRKSHQGFSCIDNVSLVLIFISLAIQFDCVNVISLKAGSPLHISEIWLGMLLSSMLIMFLFSKYDKDIKNLNILVIILGLFQIAIAMIVSGLEIEIPIKFLANILIAGMPSFAVYQISLSNSKAKSKGE